MAAENENGEEKTEDPSGRRLSEGRKDGQVAKSVELSQLVGIVAAFFALKHCSPAIWQDLILITKASLTSHYAVEPMEVSQMRTEFYALVRVIAPDVLLVMVITAFFGSFCTALQTGFLFSTHLLKPKWMHLNPLSGIKRIFSMGNFVNLAKSIAKLLIICPIAYSAFFDLFPNFLRLMDVPITDLLPFTAEASGTIFWKIVKLLLILAILDYCWNFYTFKRDMKMTKQETKEEHKTVEGDEATKRRIRAIGMRRIRDRMMKNLHTADVVVTNPTHFAVALKYDAELGGAPRVIAKGKEHLAQLIKKKAREYGIPVIERKPLARALYAMCDIGQEIPHELYKAVAELLAYVYKIRGRHFLKKKTVKPQMPA